MGSFRGSFLRLGAVAAVLLAVVAGSGQISQEAEASPPAPATSDILYTGVMKTKVNALAQPGQLHDITVTTTGTVSGPMKSVQIVQDQAGQAPGLLQINTADLATWKPALQTAAHTWVFTTKAANATTAGVHINNAFRPLQPGATLTVKFLNGSARSAIYVKLTGMAPTGVGTTRAAIESETQGLGADRTLFVLWTLPGVNDVVSTDDTVLVGFSENIDGFDDSGVVIDCGAGPVAFTTSLVNSDGVRFTPVSSLPGGATCTVTVPANAPSDADTIDPPSGLDEDFTYSFTTDAAPEVTSATPDGTQIVAVDQDFTFQFSEAVDLAASAYSYTCAPSGNNGVLAVAQPNVTSTTITGAWTQNDTCTITIHAALVTDVDVHDPPDTMAADYTLTFTVEELAPFIVSTVPANGATNVSTAANTSFTFSEPVTLLNGTTWTRYDCGPGFQGDVVWTQPSLGPQTTFVFPGAPIFAGKTCTNTIYVAGFVDADTNDPPDTMTANYTWTFSYAP